MFTQTTGQGRQPTEKPSQDQIQNQILASLPAVEYERLLPHLETVNLQHGDVIYEIDERIEHVYFPAISIISLVTQMEDGKIIEVGLVGCEGMSGMAVILGQERSGERAIVQVPDSAVRVPTKVIRDEFNRGDMLQKRLLCYAYHLMRQVSQTAACNAAHSVEERLCRWLLMCQDLTKSDHLDLTQEFIAEMLGTRRATVNVAAMTLQSANLIKYNRGRITILDRAGLEAFACECYETLKTSNGQH